MLRHFIAILLLCLAAIPGWSWGNVGHRTVGRIAAKGLNANARRNVARILDTANDDAALASAMSDAATWADDVARNRYEASRAWHFIDMSLLRGPKDLPDPFLGKNTAFAKLVQYFESIRAGAKDELEPASDLKFVIHLVGDIHQPLHCATNQDRGGNCLFASLDGEREKLHAAWDTAILESRLGTNSATLAGRLFQRFDSRPATEKEAIAGLAVPSARELVRGWILESHALAASDVYGPLRPVVRKLPLKQVDPNCTTAPRAIKGKTWRLDKSYVDAAAATIEKQLTAAGIRLAALLNRIWP